MGKKRVAGCLSGSSRVVPVLGTGCPGASRCWRNTVLSLDSVPPPHVGSLHAALDAQPTRAAKEPPPSGRFQSRVPIGQAGSCARGRLASALPGLAYWWAQPQLLCPESRERQVPRELWKLVPGGWTCTGQRGEVGSQAKYQVLPPSPFLGEEKSKRCPCRGVCICVCLKGHVWA